VLVIVIGFMPHEEIAEIPEKPKERSILVDTDFTDYTKASA
jgi:hypothetical protein